MQFNKCIINNTYLIFYIIQQINTLLVCMVQEVDIETKVQDQIFYLGDTRNTSKETEKWNREGGSPWGICVSTVWEKLNPTGNLWELLSCVLQNYPTHGPRELRYLHTHITSHWWGLLFTMLIPWHCWSVGPRTEQPSGKACRHREPNTSVWKSCFLKE